MKFKIKGEKIVREEFEVEIEANSFSDAYNKVTTSSDEIAVSHINEMIVQSQQEARFHDADPLSNIIKEVPDTVEAVRQILLINRPVKSIQINFSGSGDDGEIDYMDVFPENYSEILNDLFYSESVESIVGELAELISNHIPVDWVNESGGDGSITISLTDQDKLKVEVCAAENVTSEGPVFHDTFISD